MAAEPLRQIVYMVVTVVGCWFGMQAVHELGHCLGAWITGGRVQRVVLHPLTISRTDLDANPHPLVVAWAGPIAGGVLPLLAWVARAPTRSVGRRAANHGSLRFSSSLCWFLRLFAGFCLIANGLYIGLGSFGAIGDCGDMLRHGSQPWQLWLFGLFTAPLGLYLWHGLGPRLGFVSAPASTSSN